ncbi:unnamed protein product [Closterium sp. Naga37s-1]|nr:unnamed protein product [Closterium sp. Naga37s-1]
MKTVTVMCLCWLGSQGSTSTGAGDEDSHGDVPVLVGQSGKHQHWRRVLSSSHISVPILPHPAECTAQQAFEAVGPNALFLSGVSYPSVRFLCCFSQPDSIFCLCSCLCCAVLLPPADGKIGHSTQGNHIFLFPGIAAGALLSGARLVSEGMIHAAANELAHYISDDKVPLPAFPLSPTSSPLPFFLPAMVPLPSRVVHSISHDEVPLPALPHSPSSPRHASTTLQSGALFLTMTLAHYISHDEVPLPALPLSPTSSPLPLFLPAMLPPPSRVAH